MSTRHHDQGRVYAGTGQDNAAGRLCYTHLRGTDLFTYSETCVWRSFSGHGYGKNYKSPLVRGSGQESFSP